METTLPTAMEQFLTLGGFAALVTVIVNILKAFKVVKDGQAPTWSFVMNLIGFVAFSIVGLVNPGFDAGAIDPTLQAVASVLVTLLELVTMPAISKLVHDLTMKTVPVLGFSYSARAAKTTKTKRTK